MSCQNPHVAGAVALQRTDDTDMQDVVTSLIHLSMKERNNLASCSLSTHDEVLKDLMDYANNPAGKARAYHPGPTWSNTADQ